MQLNHPRLEGEGFEIMCRLEVDLRFVALARHSCPDFHRDKLQQESRAFWIPGRVSLARNDNSDASLSYAHGRLFQCSTSGRTLGSRTDHFAKFAFPQGEGFPPSPKGTLKYCDSDSALDSSFNFSHERGVDCSGKRTADEKRLIQSCNLFTFGH